MGEVEAMLAANRTAVSEMIAAAERSRGTWTTPRAPGKWSPSQVVEHVARVLDESANVVAGAPSKFPTFPALVRPLLRVLFFNRVLKTQVFPKSKSTKAFDPSDGASTPDLARVRLEGALVRFEQACRAQAANEGTFTNPVFGTLSVADYVKFHELHTRHHHKQLPGAG